MSLVRVLALLLTVLAAGQVCLAQTDQAGDQADTSKPDTRKPDTRKQYQVEIIAFHYLGPDSSGGEDFDRLSVKDYLPLPGFDIDQYNRLHDTISYTRLSHLSDALERLQSDPRFSVMLASAWIQPLLSKREAVDVPLGSEQGSEQGSEREGYRNPTHGANDNGAQDASQEASQDASQGMDGSQGAGQGTDQGTDQAGYQGTGQNGGPAYDSGNGDSGNGPGSGSRISGTMTVYGDRFLFVDLDLEATLPRAADGSSDLQDASGDSYAGAGAAGMAPGNDSYQVFHISEKRRIKLDEVQYFDHPYIGAIVSVTRYDGPVPDNGSADQ